MSNWDRNQAEEEEKENVDQHQQQQSSTSSSSPSLLAPCHEQDYKDAKAVASTLGISLQHVSFDSDYWTLVFEPYCQRIAQGVTPNPDTACNTHIKFGSLLDFVSRKWGRDQYLLATGHYARLWHRQPLTTTTTASADDQHHEQPYTNYNMSTSAVMPPPPDVQEALDQDSVLADWLIKWKDPMSNNNSLPPLLLSALDKSKDQSYFLSGVPGKAFANVLFPLGDLFKNDPESPATAATKYNNYPSVRALAKSNGLSTASKKDSVGLCFVGKRRNFPHFIQQYLPLRTLPPGDFVNIDNGEVIGHHDGPGLLLTVGQGAKIPGASAKWFVVGRNAQNPSTILVGAGTDHPALYTHTFQVSDMNWMAGIPPPPLLVASVMYNNGNNNNAPVKKMSAWCRARHLYDLAACDLMWDPYTNVLTVHAHAPLRAVTPGQTLAVYVGGDGLICLGGGPIAVVGPSYHDLGLTVPSTKKISSPTSTFASISSSCGSKGTIPRPSSPVSTLQSMVS